MKATLIVIENDADHAEAKALVEKLMGSSEPASGPCRVKVGLQTA